MSGSHLREMLVTEEVAGLAYRLEVTERTLPRSAREYLLTMADWWTLPPSLFANMSMTQEPPMAHPWTWARYWLEEARPPAFLTTA